MKNAYQYVKKQEFVSKYLQPLVKELNKDILFIKYIVTEKYEEYIKLTFDDVFPSGEQMTAYICVTADSLKAIVTDTLKRI